MKAQRGKHCFECGGPMPPNVHHRAVICSAECRKVRHRRQTKEALARFRIRARNGEYAPTHRHRTKS